MQQGLLYTDFDDGLPEERAHAKEVIYDYNLTRPSEENKRTLLLMDLLGSVGQHCWIEPPLHMAYGNRTHIGDNFYANFNLTIVDDVEVYIGDDVMIAPNVTITTTGHPVDPDLRKTLQQFSLPVNIKNGVWLGANVVVLPGITIGENSVIGAGSVVTRDISANVVAVGNPCRVLREIGERDREFYYKSWRV